MKALIFKRSSLTMAAMLFLVASAFWACKKEPIVYNTSSDLNITGYLEKDPQFSEFYKILDITGNKGYLGAYGNYTLFVPTNDGVKAFLQAKGKNSVEELNVQELKEIVKFHLLEDTISTPSFTDGKLPVLTMQGQYLVTGAQNVGGKTQITVNRQANMITPNVRVGNGVIHVIDHVLVPSDKTLAQLIASNPKLKVFTAALRVTGWYDKLNYLPKENPVKTNAWLTVIAETDSVMDKAGIPDSASLWKLSQLKNPTNAADSLNIFVKYHILNDAKYLADIISLPTHGTLASGEVVRAKLVGQTVTVNDLDFNGQHETGISLLRSMSDRTASNGVLHVTAPYNYIDTKKQINETTTGHLAVKVRQPVRVDWDLAEFPELTKQASVWKVKSLTFVRTVPLTTILGSGISDLYYVYSGTENTYRRDYMNVPLGAPNRNAWWEFKSPILIKGRYKVWVNYKFFQKSTSNKTVVSQVTVDGVPLQRPIDVILKRPTTGTEAEIEQQGFKQYTQHTASNLYVGRLLGVIDIPTTDSHTVRFTWISGSSGDNYLDMIQFIPEKDDQLYPRFGADGLKYDRNGQVTDK